MDGNFDKSKLFFLDMPLCQSQTAEQTQQIPLPDGMGDVGRILCACPQVIARGKEWMADRVSFSGGVMVWVLYEPEGGGPVQCIDAWLPFQLKWDLPEGTEEGSIRIRCLPRFVDARSVSARKIMVRVGLSAMAEAFCPGVQEVFTPAEVPQDVELLQNTYPIRIAREAGEKSFSLDEDLTLPDAAPQAERILSFRLNPRVTDKKVMTDKVVFRGNGQLHVLYQAEDGILYSWDFDLPFSQYADLNQGHSPDAQAEFIPMTTSLELDLDEEGHLHLKAGLVAQYLITDREQLSVIEDAYSPTRELDIQMEQLQIPAILENRRENLYGEQTIPGQPARIADVSFLPDLPRQQRQENGVTLEMPGTFQVLYYGEDGKLNSATARWEQELQLNAADQSMINANPIPSQPQAMPGSGQILVKTEMPLELTTTARQTIPMATGVVPEQQRTLDPNRPTLILRRTGNESLWNIAKASGSTVDAIRRANHLEEDPTPGQMLLIPVS